MEQKSQRKNERTSFWREERGEIGIKQIAITVGVIVLVGLSITIVNGKIGEWLDTIFGIFTKYINEITG
ncbi:hypothetical protein [Paenibacillus lutimineralis]|uniref:Uncharacterized protein n=1 Tax=Paenibacillus lutimineralis TaxID=2707005 RepID=A0A3Q9I6X0_9BACL|nr:hypothetical protein [Paenibacillus lutimineralis]AZS14034.1 hypothetical protein EI981_05915 [Paenibacillus lutimineralis]